MWKMCCQALAEHRPMDTRELSRWAATAKGMDAADSVLCKALDYRIVQLKRVGSEGIRRGVWVWCIEDAVGAVHYRCPKIGISMRG